MTISGESRGNRGGNSRAEAKHGNPSTSSESHHPETIWSRIGPYHMVRTKFLLAILPLIVIATAWNLYPYFTPERNPVATKLNNLGLDASPPPALVDHPLYGAPPDNWTCASAAHPNPVLLLHGLGSNREIYLNMLAHDFRAQGYCTFSMTYGAHAAVPWIGGLRDMRESAKEIADYIRKIVAKTGAEKVDIVGHSQGGVLALYVPMTQEGTAGLLERVIALGPAVHGADYFGFTGMLAGFGPVVQGAVQALIEVLGCEACVDMMDGPRGTIYHDFKNAKRITQPGNKVTIIVSTYDTLVAPPKSVVEEDGVRNVYIQDQCPDDRVGHNGLAWDKAVWGLVKNALEEQYERAIECDKGIEI